MPREKDMQQTSGVLLHLLLRDTTAGTEEGKGWVQEWAVPASLHPVSPRQLACCMLYSQLFTALSVALFPLLIYSFLWRGQPHFSAE